jgi:hypothetical protein
MKWANFRRSKRSITVGVSTLGILLIIFGFVGPDIPLPASLSTSPLVYAAGCPSGPEPSGGPTSLGICLTENGNQLTSASGFTVSVSQTIGTATKKYGTTFAKGLFITSADMAPVGAALANCQGNAAIPYELEITATNGTATFKTAYSACNDNPDFLYPVTLAVSATATTTTIAGFGAVSGCITYKAPDGTSQPFDGNATGSGSPATAVISGPTGNSKSITVGFTAAGCLTGTEIKNLAAGTYTIDANYAPGQTAHGLVQAQEYQKTFTITKNKTTNITGVATAATSTANTTFGTSTAGNTTTPGLTCNAGWNPLNWLLCATVKGLVTAANQLDNLVSDELAVGTQNNSKSNGAPTGIFGPCAAGTTCGAPEYKDAWESFRDIALGLLVVVGLFVVLSTALGLEILDAYTVRKVLPRIVIIAIAITLSWNLLDLFITFTNDLGYGIRYLIYKPFETLKLQFLISGFTGVAIDLIGGAAITAMGIFGLLLAAAAGVIAIFSFLFLLIIRQVLITGLIIFAPIALVAYILPNTQRLYTMWWDILSKAALLGVIVEGIIALARVGAAIADQNPSPVNQLVAFVAYFGGYFFAFSQGPKMAGAGVGAIAGAASRMTQGTRGAINKKQSENVGKKVTAARKGQRWNEQFGRFTNPLSGDGRWAGSKFAKSGVGKRLGKFNSIGNIGNRMAINAFDQDELSRYRAGKAGIPGFKRYATKTDEQIADAGLHGSFEGLQEIEKNGGMNMRAYQAITGEGTFELEDDAENTKAKLAKEFQNEDGTWRSPSSLNDFNTMAEIMSESSNDNTRLGGTQLEKNAGFLATMKSHPGMEYADMKTMGMLGAASQGHAGPKFISDVHNAMSDAGNGALASRAVGQSINLGQAFRPDIRMGHGLIPKVNHKTGNVHLHSAFSDPDSGTAQAAIASINSSGWMQARPEAVIEQKQAIIAAANNTSNPERARQVQAMVASQAGQYGGSMPETRREFEEIKQHLEAIHGPLPQSQDGPGDPGRAPTTTNPPTAGGNSQGVLF